MAAVTSEVAPPMTPAMASGCLPAVGDQQVLGQQRALDVVQRPSAARPLGAADHDGAAQPVETSNACSGWPSASMT